MPWVSEIEESCCTGCAFRELKDKFKYCGAECMCRAHSTDIFVVDGPEDEAFYQQAKSNITVFRLTGQYPESDV